MSNFFTPCSRLLNLIAVIAAILMLIAAHNHDAAAGQTESAATDVNPSAIHVDLAQDWPWWRGVTHDGIANPHQHPPVQWSDSENVVWKTNLPGRGHGSPRQRSPPGLTMNLTPA